MIEKGNERSFRTIEDLISVFIDSLPFIALVLKKQTREIVACNKVALEAGAVIGKTCFETLPQCNHVCPFCKAPSLWETGKAQSVRTDYLGRHWEGRWFHIADDLYIHYVWDITEQIRTSEELQKNRQKISDARNLLTKSESRFRSIFESSFLGIAFWDMKGEIFDANEAYLELVGYSRDDLISGKVNWADMTPPEYADLDRKGIQELNEIGYCKPFEKEYIRKDGSRIQILIGGAFIEGLVDGGVTFVIDISERKKTEKALHESEENMRYIVKHDPNAIAVYDRDLHYIAVSDRYLRDYSVREEDVIGKHHYDVFPEMPQRWKDVHQRCLSGIIERNDDDYFERPDGSVTYNSWECRPWYLSTGEIGGMITYTEVTTERKLAEKALKESNESLEKLNNHLVEIRENERALIARELHDQLGQSLTALKLDINRIKGFVGSDPNAIRLHTKMVEMVSSLIIDVQRITADLRPGILDDLGLGTAIDWYCGEFSERTGIKCRLRLGNLTDPDSHQSLIFFRILQEALTNIIRHANATLVRITLRQSQKGITLSIHDNGRGITKEQAESGKSLGLAGIRERIKQYKGVFRISSGEDAGTKLIVFLPIKKT